MSKRDESKVKDEDEEQMKQHVVLKGKPLKLNPEESSSEGLEQKNQQSQPSNPDAENTLSQVMEAGTGPVAVFNKCLQRGCPNPGVVNSEWEDEYCSFECAVSHCREAFKIFVKSQPEYQEQQQ